MNKLQLLALLALLFAAAFAMAQGIVTGSISGTVEDAQGAVVTNAKITAKEVATNREYTGETGSSGIFTLRALPPGTYTVTIEAPNFRKYENKGVTVSVGGEAGLGRIKMEVGSSSETLTVEGTAPLVETGTQQITATFDSQQARDLPVGNTLDSLALFIPGVASAGDTGFSNNNGAEISVNGQRARSNNFQIDGQANNDNSIGGPSFFFGNQDAVSELQVVTNYSAEYGRNMGAVVNYITKSGTNAFHGSGYELFNGSTFDSLTNQSKSALFNGPNGLPWCQKGQNPANDGCDKTFVPRVVDNRFGGTIGGPVLKDKMWFFGSTHFQRQRFGASPSNSGGAILPTPEGLAELQADFPGNAAVAVLGNIGPYAVKAGNPGFGAPLPFCIDTDFVPPCNPYDTLSADGGETTVPGVPMSTFSRFISSLFNDREITGRVDLKVTNKDNFFGRYIFQQFISTGVAGGNGIAVGDFVDVPGRSQQIGLDWSRQWSTTFVNTARFSFSRAGFGFEGGAFPGCTRSNINNCPTNISIGDGFTAGFGLATNLPQGRTINVYQVQDNASWQVGKMTIKLGGEYSKQRSPNVFLPTTNGQYIFGDFNSFLADDPAFINAALGNPKLPFKENDLAFYVQNDWRIKDNLTLNLGLRWEWFQQAVNLLHDRSLAQQTSTSPFWDPTLDLSRTTIPYIPQDLNNFSPVVGFAWTPRVMRKFMGEDKTVVRGGFHIGYDPSFYNIFLNTGTSAPVVNITSAPGPGPGFLPASGLGSDVQALVQPLLPVGSDPGLRRQVLVSRNFHNPYSEQWNFGIQRSFGGSQRVVAEARYVGSHTLGNFQSVNANPALKLLIDNGFSNLIPAGLTPCSDPTQPGFSRGFVDCTKTRVLSRQNSAFASYHSLQTNLRTANWHGITATASYTFSKVLDNATEIFSNLAGGTTLAFAQNPFNAGKGEKAVSGIDFPHNFSLALIYDLPFYKSQHGITGKVLGGWQLNTTYRYSTGQPYTTIQSRFAGIGTSFCDPRATLSGFFDACRPILSNPAAAIDSIGICDPDSEGCSLLNWVDFQNDIFTPVSASDVRWIVNDRAAAFASGSPFLGAGRNSLRGQNISSANLALFKNAKLTEKVTLQLRATAYNVLNHQFLGVPDPLLDDALAGTFQSRNFNSNGGSSSNVLTDGLAQRRLELGLKILF
ncbi:MAG: TonB-dependent receptor [Candidatus Koribacter versatilis]|nr:TonB-dependent receptor [Candidatus Koribacter versatilis]